MAPTKLDDIPPEVLKQVCSDLWEEDPRSLLSLSLVSNYLRTVSATVIFQRIKITTKPPSIKSLLDPTPPTPDTRVNLLRTVVTNPEIAAVVQHVDWDDARCPPVSDEDFDFVKKTACILGVQVPSLLRLGDDHPNKEGDYRRLDFVHAFFLELIVAHLPNLRDFKTGVGGHRKFLETLLSAHRSGMIRRHPMFPKLETLWLVGVGSNGNLVQTLAEMAPNLQNLRLFGVTAPILGLHCRNVRFFHLRGMEFTGRDLSNFLQGFPSLRKVNLDCDYEGDVKCTPQEAINTLEPFMSQLAELSLHFSLDSSGYGTGTRPRRRVLQDCIKSLKQFEVLEVLEIGTNCLCFDDNTCQDFDADEDGAFARLLPRTLKTLNLMHHTQHAFDHDLPMLADHVKNCCPELRSVENVLSFDGPLSKERLEQLRQIRSRFSSQGVDFNYVDYLRMSPCYSYHSESGLPSLDEVEDYLPYN